MVYFWEGSSIRLSLAQKSVWESEVLQNKVGLRNASLNWLALGKHFRLVCFYWCSFMKLPILAVGLTGNIFWNGIFDDITTKASFKGHFMCYIYNANTAPRFPQNSIWPFLTFKFKITSSKSKVNNIKWCQIISIGSQAIIYLMYNSKYCLHQQSKCHNSPTDCCGLHKNNC